MKTFHEVAWDSLEETRRKFEEYWSNSREATEAVNFALGLFTGIVDRRIHEIPDPDPPSNDNENH